MRLSHGQQITHAKQIRISVSSIKRKKALLAKISQNVVQRNDNHGSSYPQD